MGTRLRRTFAYPTESDSDDPPELDEEHQEALLTTLQSQDEATSSLYRRLFLVLPVSTSLAYVPAFAWASGATETFVALLSVVVPALAAWILWAYPIGGEGKKKGGLRGLGSGGEGAEGGKLPVRYFIVLGTGLAGMSILQSGVLWWAVDSELRTAVPAGRSFHSFLLLRVSSTDVVLPVVVFFLTLFVRQQLALVDLEELRKARYELKGA
jgi:hypothetical protein